MGSRGRTSVAEHSVASAVIRFERPGAPPELSETEADLWFLTVNQMPADWFSDETLKLLQAYCVAASTHDRIANQLKQFKDEWLANDDGLRRFARLTEIQGRQAKLLKDLATSMRLTQQSRYRADKAIKSAQGAGKPWESPEK
jgi:hypothetical protein